MSCHFERYLYSVAYQPSTAPAPAPAPPDPPIPTRPIPIQPHPHLIPSRSLLRYSKPSSRNLIFPASSSLVDLTLFTALALATFQPAAAAPQPLSQASVIFTPKASAHPPEEGSLFVPALLIFSPSPRPRPSLKLGPSLSTIVIASPTALVAPSTSLENFYAFSPFVHSLVSRAHLKGKQSPLPFCSSPNQSRFTHNHNPQTPPR